MPQSRLLVVRKAESTCKREEFLTTFRLDQLEAHGQQSETEEQVERAGHSLRLVSPGVGLEARNDVAEADGGEGDEAEVGAVEVAPVFPQREENGAQVYVARHHDETHRDRHAHHFLLRHFRLLQLAVRHVGVKVKG